MRSLHKKPPSAGAPGRVLRATAGAHGAGDLQSRQISRIRRQLGNEGMSKAGDASSARDTLLAFICQRLRKMREVQLQEHASYKQVRSWYRAVAAGRDGYFAPDATRFHEAARFFKEAAEAMCRGNLSRGAQLLERALGAEQAALDTVPRQVREHLSEEQKAGPGYPSELPQSLDAAALPPCAVPEALDIADHILALEDRFLDTPPRRVRRQEWWWNEGELGAEDDEDDEDKPEGRPPEAEPEEEEEEEPAEIAPEEQPAEPAPPPAPAEHAPAETPPRSPPSTERPRARRR